MPESFDYRNFQHTVLPNDLWSGSRVVLPSQEEEPYRATPDGKQQRLQRYLRQQSKNQFSDPCFDLKST